MHLFHFYHFITSNLELPVFLFISYTSKINWLNSINSTYISKGKNQIAGEHTGVFLMKLILGSGGPIESLSG